MKTIRLTMAQALVKYLSRQFVELDGREVPYFAGVWAIFGHGNVAGLGEALYSVRDELPTYRGHNEQGMAHAAIAYAKTMARRRAMVCTTSIGPGATNMVTAAAVAHVNRLPLLLLPGDVFASRAPDPVLQQVEDFADGNLSANDCFRPVSRYFDRITRPEQIVTALPRAMATLMDAANCGPVTLALCQDVQAEAYDYPQAFFEKRLWSPRVPQPDATQIEQLLSVLDQAERPLLIAGGGVHYSGACEALRTFAEASDIPVAETQAGKSALPWDHPQCLGGIGVTGTSAANAAASEADLVIGLGTRLQDFTTGSRALFKNEQRQLVQVNAAVFDSYKHNAMPVVADAKAVIEALQASLVAGRESIAASSAWKNCYQEELRAWFTEAERYISDDQAPLPSDAQVIGGVQRGLGTDAMVVCAAGGLPGELHRLWRAERPGGYHLEYGYSCMGYEIAGGTGAKMAAPDQQVVVMVGDGSYLMMNSDIATAVALGLQLIIVVLDNRGFGCINRLQVSTGSAGFNNLLQDTYHERLPDIDFAAHAASLGAHAEKVSSVAELEATLKHRRTQPGVSVVVIDTDPLASTDAGGHWWDVAVPEVSDREEVNAAYSRYQNDKQQQRVDG